MNPHDNRKLTFFTNPMSRGRLTRWMIEETGLSYDTVVLEFGGTIKGADYLGVNPMGKVPALRHGDKVITENAAICLYLADLVPELGLAPPMGSAARGDYYRWILFMAGPLEALLTAQQAGALAQPVSAGYGREGDTLDVLEAALQGCEHLAGDRFTAADLYVAACLGYYMRIHAVPARPAFTAFVQRHMGRPAQVRAEEIDNALLPPQ